VRTTENFKVVYKLGLFLLVACLLTSPVVGQEKTSEINGVATDETGGILPGVTVTVINSTTGRSVTSLTSENGSYKARPLEPGRYSVKFAFAGEGDTMVVDTKGFNEKFWFDNGGLPHTEQLHLIERFTRADMKTMRYEVTVDDPGAYTRQWKSSWTLEWIPGEELPYFLCQDNRP